MTTKKAYDAEGLRQFISDRAVYHAGGHHIYTGPPTVQCNFKETAVPRAWWLLNGKAIPPGQYLLNTCGRMNCIDYDHHALSHSPHSVAAAPKRPELAKLRRALEAAQAALEALEGDNA